MGRRRHRARRHAHGPGRTVRQGLAAAQRRHRGLGRPLPQTAGLPGISRPGQHPRAVADDSSQADRWISTRNASIYGSSRCRPAEDRCGRHGDRGPLVWALICGWRGSVTASPLIRRTDRADHARTAFLRSSKPQTASGAGYVRCRSRAPITCPRPRSPCGCRPRHCNRERTQHPNDREQRRGRPHQPRRTQTRPRRTGRPDTHRATTRHPYLRADELDQAKAYAEEAGAQGVEQL